VVKSKTYISLFLLFFACLSVSIAATDLITLKEGDTNEDIKSTTVSFELVQGLIIIEATVTGYSGNYILDTGASSILVNKKVTEPEFYMTYINGDLPAESMSASDISIGENNYPINDVLAVDLSEISQIINTPIAGIIGSKVLSEYNVVIDYEWSEVTLLPKEQRSISSSNREYLVTSLPFTLENDGMMVVPVQVGENSGRFLFDTGATINVMNTPIENSETRYEDLKINSINIKEAPFVTNNLSDIIVSKNERSSLDGILSPYTLSANKVIIDFTNQKIHFFWDKEVEGD